MLENLSPNDRRRLCKIRTISADLDENDLRILENAIADVETWSINGLMVALRERGLQVTRETLDRHRRGLCSC